MLNRHLGTPEPEPSRHHRNPTCSQTTNGAPLDLLCLSSTSITPRNRPPPVTVDTPRRDHFSPRARLPKGPNGQPRVFEHGVSTLRFRLPGAQILAIQRVCFPGSPATAIADPCARLSMPWRDRIAVARAVRASEGATPTSNSRSRRRKSGHSARTVAWRGNAARSRSQRRSVVIMKRSWPRPKNSVAAKRRLGFQLPAQVSSEPRVSNVNSSIGRPP